MSGVFSGQSLHDIGTGSLVSQKPGNFGLLVCLQTSLTWILRIWILFLMLGVQLFLPSELFLFLSTFLFKDIKSNISIPVEVSLEASGVRSPWTWDTVICEPPRVVWKNSELLTKPPLQACPQLSKLNSCLSWRVPQERSWQVLWFILPLVGLEAWWLLYHFMFSYDHKFLPCLSES